MEHIDLFRRNYPVRFLRALEELIPVAYQKAYSLSMTEFEGNRPHMCGVMRWGKCDDALFDAAKSCSLHVERVYCSNGQQHTEVYSEDLVLIVKKVDEPGKAGGAAYKKELAKPNWQFDFFESIEDKWERGEIEKELILVELTHGPYEDDRSKPLFMYVVFSDEEGRPTKYFPLSSVYPCEDGGEFDIEEVPDLVGPTPKTGNVKRINENR